MFLSLLATEQNVGVVPAQLGASLDVGRGHEGDLPGRAGGDHPGVGETGVRHEGDLGVEIAGPGSLTDLAHTVSLQDSVGVLHISSRHPGQPQP